MATVLEVKGRGKSNDRANAMHARLEANEVGSSRRRQTLSSLKLFAAGRDLLQSRQSYKHRVMRPRRFPSAYDYQSSELHRYFLHT